MVLFIANIAVIIVVGLVLWRRGRDRRVEGVPSARRLRAAALVPLALQVGIFLLFGIGEMAGGDLSGAGHLLQGVTTVLPAILAWMRPLEGGAGLLAAGVLCGVEMFGAATAAEAEAISPALTILAVPQVVSGALFLLAGVLARRATPPATCQG